MRRTRETDIAVDVFNPLNYHAAEDKKQVLLDAIQSLTGMELLEMNDAIKTAFNKVISKDENFFLHDFIDNWLYIVSFENGDEHIYYKGKEAYHEYTSIPGAVAITRKSKDLFPTFQTMMSKQEGYVYMPIQKGEKEMSKKEYDIQYQKDHTKRVYFVLNKDIDFDIINYLAGKDNVNGFLKKLIREQMRKERKEKAE